MIKKHKLSKKDKEYIPRYPEKYIGMYPIICRSTWEYRMCEWLDFNDEVIDWSSESHRIKYIDPYGKSRVYYPDFYAKIRNKGKFIVEVKPLKDMRMPNKKGKKSEKTMMIRKHTYLLNEAKFKAAEQYCKKLGYKFVIITEKDLFRG